MNFSALIPCFLDTFSFVSVSCHAGIFFNFPILVPLLPSHLDFFTAWGFGINLCTKSSWFNCRDVIFVIPVRHTFQSYSHSFVGIDNTRIFGLAFPNTAAGFSAAIYWCFTRHCCWYRNSQLPAAVFHDVLEVLVLRSTEEDTTWLPGIIELWFLDSPLSLRFAFRCIRHMLPHIWPYIVGSWGCLCPRLSPDHVYPSGGLSFNKMNLVKPVHASDNSLSPSTFQ